MRVTMVKKQFADGSTCQKCVQAEELLRRRGLWDRIERVTWAKEADPTSEGMRLAEEHQLNLAPFFVVERDSGTQVYTSVLKLIAEVLAPPAPITDAGASEIDVEALGRELAGLDPQQIVTRALSLFGRDCVIAFSGAEDVALIDMAAKSGQPFRVLTLDTGRLHSETYRFIDRVRTHFGVEIELWFPDAVRVEALVRKKGLFSFYEDGHGECCDIRKVGPLGRALSECRAWMTGQRRDQSPTRTDVKLVQRDSSRKGRTGPLVKWNPLAAWSLGEVWTYIRENELPYNALHDQGFVSIGCEPCTRAVRPGEHERAGRWWWEEATKRECGLHVPKG
ncbi:MAG TPA: phosphoadenylyl-sulfate reductase [Polyangiaceae bacterium]|jgi:phosphoadenosine phosphosulfate reductase|nr:phosphoadenylyl-sulfate reductase [Polyangiaceae bacterium]